MGQEVEVDPFELYLEKYSFKHHITKEEAKTHLQVKFYKEMLDERSRK